TGPATSGGPVTAVGDFNGDTLLDLAFVDQDAISIRLQGPTPFISAGDDIEKVSDQFESPVAVALSATVVAHPAGGHLTFRWFEGTTFLGEGQSITASFAVGIHAVTVVATDERGLTGSDTVAVKIRLPEPTTVVGPPGKDGRAGKDGA